MDFISAVTALKEGKCEGYQPEGWPYGRVVLNDQGIMVWERTGERFNASNPDYYLYDNYELVPKPKVIKRIEGWINVYGDWIGRIYRSKEEASHPLHRADNALGDPLHIVHVYEVEE
jgi:hypothetical protein